MGLIHIITQPPPTKKTVLIKSDIHPFDYGIDHFIHALWFLCLKLKTSKIAGLNWLNFSGRLYNYLGVVLSYFLDLFLPFL